MDYSHYDDEDQYYEDELHDQFGDALAAVVWIEYGISVDEEEYEDGYESEQDMWGNEGVDEEVEYYYEAIDDCPRYDEVEEWYYPPHKPASPLDTPNENDMVSLFLNNEPEFPPL